MMSSMDASALSRQNQKDVRPMLDLVDEMRRLGVEKEVPLPQIAVMGDQSCGCLLYTSPSPRDRG